MSISSAIFAARSGLQISGQRAEVVANNVANANTPGYVRRTLLVGEFMSGQNMTGVVSLGIGRSADDTVTAMRREISSDVAKAEVLSSTWQAISKRIGDSASGAGLFSAFSGFESALAQSVTSPESTTNLTSLLEAARYVTRELNAVSEFAIRNRAQADQKISAGVDAVNSALQQIRDINTRLARTDPKSALSATLLDERQRLLDEVARFVPIEAVKRDNETVDVMTREGVFLVNGGTVRELEFTPAPTLTPDKTLANGDLSGLFVEGIELTPGASSFGALSGGEFSALFMIRDTDMPELIGQLDLAAEDLITRFSADAIDPTKAAGAPGLFIDPYNAGSVGLASRIALNPAIDPSAGGEMRRLRDGIGSTIAGPPGNASILRGMYDAFTQARDLNSNGIRGSFSASGLAAELSSVAGRKRLFEDSVMASSQAQHLALLQAEQEQTKVDVDREMEDLLMIETAYAANARVMQVAGDMLNILMEI